LDRLCSEILTLAAVALEERLLSESFATFLLASLEAVLVSSEALSETYCAHYYE
jgi:hypothetical protein